MACKIYIAATAGDVSAAAGTGFKIAQMIYRAGADGSLYRAENAPEICGGIAVVECAGTVQHVERLSEEIAKECAKRGFDGVVPEGAAPALAHSLIKRGIRVFTEECGYVPGSAAIIGTAMSGGGLKIRLQEAKMKYGRIAAEIDLVRMDFRVPERSGVGRKLSIGELDAIMNRYQSRVFYSEELQTWHFHYRAPDGVHMVLYDNSSSLVRKMHVIREVGADCAFVSWEQVRHMKAGILREMQV